MSAKIRLIGRLGKDPKRIASEMPFVVFSVATNHKSKGETITTWWSIKVFGKTANNCLDYIRKGSLVMIEGRPELNQWTADDGSQRAEMAVVANEVEFLDSKSKDDAQYQPQSTRYTPPQSSAPAPYNNHQSQGYYQPSQSYNNYQAPGSYQPPPVQQELDKRPVNFPYNDDLPF